MKFLIATPFTHSEEGVLGVYAEGLTTALRAMGHTVIHARRINAERLLPFGIRHLVYGIRIIPKVVQSDAVLALDTISVGLPALIAARLMRKPFGIRIGGDFLWESYVERTKEPVLLSEFYKAPHRRSLKENLIFPGTRYILRHADALIFTTKFQRELWQKVHGFPEEKAHIVENYFPPQTIALTSMGRVFVSAGRDIFLKNMQTLKRAFARVAAKNPGISLDTRLLPHEEHLRRLENSYAVVIPSFSEVCSNSAIDAVSYGKPFIMSRDTGTSERLGECGLYIDTRSEDELVVALEALLEPERYKSFERAVRRNSFEHSWDAMAREIIQIYESL